MQQQLVLMRGISYSGKSTIAGQLLELNPNAKIVSSDDIRAELFGDAAIQRNAACVFAVRDLRVEDLLKSGADVIADSMHLTTRGLSGLIAAAKAHNVRVTMVSSAVTLEEAKRRHHQVVEHTALRPDGSSRVVPERVLEVQYEMQKATPLSAFFELGVDSYQTT